MHRNKLLCYILLCELLLKLMFLVLLLEARTKFSNFWTISAQ